MKSLATRWIGVSMLWIVLGSTPTDAQPADVIVIERGGVRPLVARTMVERRVLFVNRSGELVHIEFHGLNGHHVAQVPGNISAVFHKPGRHEYVVHMEPRQREVHGAVDVADDPELRTGPPTCPSVSVRGVCIEP